MNRGKHFYSTHAEAFSDYQRAQSTIHLYDKATTPSQYRITAEVAGWLVCQRTWSLANLERSDSASVGLAAVLDFHPAVSSCGSPYLTSGLSWDDYYSEEISNLEDEADDDGTTPKISTWFDEVKAPQKILKFLTSPAFPLAPSHFLSREPSQCPSVIDLGTGNGQTLFELRGQGGYRGKMVGVDYSETSVQLSRQLVEKLHHDGDMIFEVMDIIAEDRRKQSWWPEDGFDLVLDKGTFDAVSLNGQATESASFLALSGDSARTRTHTMYPLRALEMVKPGGFLLVTSCNWTQEEVITWFTTGRALEAGQFTVFDTINYPKFRFGGQEGQGVSTVCFRKVVKG